MKVLVTGGAGYKGIVLVSELLDRGHHVTILDNFLYGYESVLHLVEHPNLSITKVDIRNIEQSHLKDADVIFHLAGISGYPACEANPHSAKLINIDASKRLGEMASRDQWIIYASTTSFYGSTGDERTEQSNVEPVSMYGITKYEAERLLMERENTVALRFATVFGISPRMRVDLLPNDFAFKAVNDRCIVVFESRTRRTFLHIKDAIRAYIMAMEEWGSMRGQIFNVGGNGMNYTKQEVAEHIQKLTNCRILESGMNDFDVRNFIVRFDKIAGLGYVPAHTFDQGIAEVLKLYSFYRPFEFYRTI